MCTTGFKVTGLFEQQGSHECDDQRGSRDFRSFIDLLAHHSAEHQKLIDPYA
jgi:hypothetical protein